MVFQDFEKVDGCRHLSWSCKLGLILSVQHFLICEYAHHTNGSKAPKSAHYMIYGLLVDYVICRYDICMEVPGVSRGS